MKALKIHARLLGQFAKSVIFVGFFAASHMAIASTSPSPSIKEVAITRPVARQSGFPECTKSLAECKQIDKCYDVCLKKFKGLKFSMCRSDCRKQSVKNSNVQSEQVNSQEVSPNP